MTTRKAAYSYMKRHDAGTYRSGLEEANSAKFRTLSH